MCNCDFCKTHDKHRWSSIKECGCFCHASNEIVGHDSLCCEYPNGKKKDNPYREGELQHPSYYNKLMEEVEYD